MKMDNPARRRTLLAGGALASAAVLVLAGCAKKAATTTGSGTSGSPTPGAAASPSGTGQAKLTVMASTIPGAGAVLVNGNGMTFYALTSEAGGKVTCTDSEMSNGTACTTIWPDSELPAGMTAGVAGTGVTATLLGTATGPTGDKYLTYAGYPLYNFFHDAAPGDIKGEGITSFGGTWEMISPAGTLIPKTAVTAATPPSPSPSPTKAAGSGGYGY